MNIWNILTADRKMNPIALRLYFSKLRFAREDARVKDLPLRPLLIVQGDGPRGGAGPVLFAVADVGYFTRFANMFASSAAINSPRSAVHIHVLGDRRELPRFDLVPKHFTVSYEAADFSKMSSAEKGRYCQCMRFVRLAQFVKASARDYVAFDIDGLFQKDFSTLILSTSVGLICRPEYRDHGLRINAGVVFMRANTEAQEFMDAASSHMLQHVLHASFTEKLDQRCLSMAMAKFPNAVSALDAKLYSFTPGQGYFYSAKGKAKDAELRRVFEESIEAGIR